MNVSGGSWGLLPVVKEYFSIIKALRDFFYIKSDEERNMAFGDRLIGAGPKSLMDFPE